MPETPEEMYARVSAARMPQLKGSFAATWDDVLPAVPEAVWRADLEAVRR